MGATGLEHPHKPPKDSRDARGGGNKSGNNGEDGRAEAAPDASVDPELAAVVAAWAELPYAVRAGIGDETRNAVRRKPVAAVDVHAKVRKRFLRPALAFHGGEGAAHKEARAEQQHERQRQLPHEQTVGQ